MSHLVLHYLLQVELQEPDVALRWRRQYLHCHQCLHLLHYLLLDERQMGLQEPDVD